VIPRKKQCGRDKSLPFCATEPYPHLFDSTDYRSVERQWFCDTSSGSSPGSCRTENCRSDDAHGGIGRLPPNPRNPAAHHTWSRGAASPDTFSL